MQWDRLYYVGGDAKQSGTMQGEIAAQVIRTDHSVDRNADGKIQYVLLEGETGHQDAIIRTDSVVKKPFRNRGSRWRSSATSLPIGTGDRQKNKMTQLIHHYGDEIELVLSNNDEMAMGAVAAYEASGYPKENRPVIFGIDGLDSALDAIQNDLIQGTVYNDRAGQAEQISRLAMDLFQGKELEGYDFEK